MPFRFSQTPRPEMREALFPREAATTFFGLGEGDFLATMGQMRDEGREPGWRI
jgi:hypothetical protein